MECVDNAVEMSLDESQVTALAHDHEEGPHFFSHDADLGPFVDDSFHGRHHEDLVIADPRSANASEQEEEPPSFFSRGLSTFKYIFSMILVLFSVVVVTAAIFTKQTTATGDNNVHPVVAFFVFWILILWLALMEGGLNCMVGLQPIDKALYAQSHPLARRCTVLAHRGDNVERFIVGRQYLDLMSVFMTAFMVSAIDDAAVLGLPEGLNKAFLGSGLAVILVTIVFGQLIAQINAAHCMLDFINNYVMLITTYLALIVEGSGILHAVYLVQIFFSKLSGKPIESNEPPKSSMQKFLFWARVLMSVAILVGAFVVSLAALFKGYTTMWEGVPPIASVFILIGLIGLVGLMEGLQIALFAVVHLPADEVQHHPAAQRNCQLVFRGQNLQAFLIGRQILQTVIMFVIARITTVDMKDSSRNLFGVSDALQSFFDTGILGALISTIVASLSWRIVASSFPVAFLASPLSVWIIRLCLAVEWTGVCYSAWFFAAIQRKLIRFERDETYVGTAEDRATKDCDDLELTEEAHSFEVDDN